MDTPVSGELHQGARPSSTATAFASSRDDAPPDGAWRWPASSAAHAGRRRRWRVHARLAIVHLAFGFVYGDWRAATGPLLWSPLGLFVSDEGVAARMATAVLVVAALAVLVAAGVAIRKLLRRSARWRSFEERSQQDAGALALWPGITLGLGLAASMWVADALTPSPLVVFLVAAAGWFGVRRPRTRGRMMLQLESFTSASLLRGPTSCGSDGP